MWRAANQGTDEALSEGDDEREDGICRVCIANVAQHRMRPCNHALLCFECGVNYIKNFRKNILLGDITTPQTVRCPLCRTDVAAFEGIGHN